MNSRKKIEWKALEHHHTEKSNDWFWAVGIIAIGFAILAIYFHNLLFALVILLGAFASILHAHTPPKILDYALTRKGIQIGDRLYPYSSLESFCVIDEEINDKIMFRSKKMFMALIIIPFDSTRIDPEEISDFLLDYLDEEELHEPFLQVLMEFFGF